MRRFYGCCLLLLLLSGCAAQQPDMQNDYYAVTMPSLSTLKTSKAKAKRQTPTLQSLNDTGSMRDIRKTLLSEFDAWAGTPYRLGGQSKVGVDCSSLVQQVYRDGFDIELPRTTTGQVLQGRRIDKAALKPGDLVFFKPSRRYRHVGIYVGEGYFLHASSSQGVKLSRLDNPYWSQHYWQSRRPLDQTELAMRSLAQNDS
ncbi:C40 family peptidase [Phytohalomonas tamaricis]|uniref:C40 family peptidase n=1 Tax=Phytohalomonas tamaricis TaxID=2081032 RepID=UPI000D0B01CC|nr:NlpC/P60 family protein [Phytohalomonas tamaricis]